MQVKDPTLKGAIRKALGKSDPHAKARKRCSNLAARLGPIEGLYERLLSSLETVQRELDRVDQERNPILQRLALTAIDLLARGRQIRGGFRVLQLMASGEFSLRTLRAMKSIVDFTEDVRKFLQDAEALSRNLDEWEQLQNSVVQVSRARGPVYQAMTELRDEFERSRCANLPAQQDDEPMS